MTDNQQQRDLAVRITIAGEPHEFRVGDYTAVEARLFRGEMGVSLQKIFRTGDLDIDVIAALMWLHRRRDNPRLTYDEVASELTYDDLRTPDTDDDAVVDPEASAGS